MNIGKTDLVYYRHNFFGEVKSIAKSVILFNELTIVTKGCMTYTVNGENITINESDAIFIPYGSERFREFQTTADFVSFNFVDENDYSVFERVTNSFADNEVIALLKLSDLFTSNNIGDVKEKLTGILYALLAKMFDYYTQPKYSQLTISIIKYLEEHLTEHIQLKDIEKNVFLTSNYFDKTFKKETGYSIIKYFNYLKFERAKLLINEQEKSLEEISSLLGFSDYNYFSRLFKKYNNLTPTEYKKQFLIKL